VAVIDGICNDRQTAISILETIGNALLSETQKSALRAVADYIRHSVHDGITRMTPEERQVRIAELLKKAGENP